MRAAVVISPDLFRAVFRQHAAGVAVVTALGEHPVGFTVSSLASVSADPPMVSFVTATTASSWPVLAEAEYVGIHVLAEHQHDLAARFAAAAADRFQPPTRWRLGPYDIPLLADAPVWMACRVVNRVPAGDRRLLLAELHAAEASGKDRPLLYHQGRFTALR